MLLSKKGGDVSKIFSVRSFTKKTHPKNIRKRTFVVEIIAENVVEDFSIPDPSNTNPYD